jgi:hypothetical protein
VEHGSFATMRRADALGKKLIQNRANGGFKPICSFRMMVETLCGVSRCRLKGKECPLQVPGAGRGRAEPGGSQAAGLVRLLLLPLPQGGLDLSLFRHQPAGDLSLEAALQWSYPTAF